MKKFTKNVLACLGIGAVLSGAGVMTGCSNMEITADQQNKIFNALDTANEFMGSTSNNMTNIQTAIENLNQTLNNDLENNDSELLYSDAIGVMKRAIVSFLTNAHGEWDNMRVSRKVSGEKECTYSTYKNNDDVRIAFNHSGSLSFFCIESDEYTYNGRLNSSTIAKNGDSFYVNLCNWFLSAGIERDVFEFENINVDNIGGVEVSNTGKTSIQLVITDSADEVSTTDYFDYIKVVINEKGLLESIKHNSVFINPNNAYYEEESFKVEYNVLDDSEMQGYITDLLARPIN